MITATAAEHSYQDDLTDRRELLSTDITLAIADLARARHALRRLTELDGPQHLDVGNGIAAAERQLAQAHRSLTGNSHPSASTWTSISPETPMSQQQPCHHQAQMRLWRNNRLDAEFTRPIGHLAEQFRDSPWADVPWPVERAVAAFLADSDGPISAVWDSTDGSFEQLVDAIVEHRQAAS